MRTPCALLLPALLAASGAASAAAQSLIRVTLIDTAVIAAPRLDESSGIAPSRRAGVYWTHNDSGDGPILYATDSAGQDLGSVRVRGARNVDWEDLARGPCGDSPATCLFVGDIGDNDRRRPWVVVYVVPEPDPPTGPSDTARQVAAIDLIRLRYPDHPHDAEALVVTRDARVLIITKDLSGSAGMFSAPLTGHGVDPVTLAPVCTLALDINALRGRLVTGAALSPDGRRLVVRTYVSLHVFELEGCRPLLPERGIGIPVVETQGEGITFDAPDRLVLTGERGGRGHAILSRYRIEGLRQR